ncbi:MAG: methyltransferase [Oscillospiraceae bacterium]|nr:methyltransferase [Oscillospiraceae bacterium]
MEYEVFGFKGIKLFISEEHRFGTDSLLLGEFAAGSKRMTVVDLCSGCGIVPVLLSGNSKNTPKKIYAVEIQSQAADLIRQTVHENNLGSFIEVIEGDLREKETLEPIGRERIDLVTANPPYYPKQSGFERGSNAQKTARYERDCTITDVVKAAEFLLKFGGELKMCMIAPRLAECIGIMREHSIEPKEIVLIPSKKTKTARLFLISGKKNGKAGVRITWK